VWLTARCEAAGRRRTEDHSHDDGCQDTGARRLSVLWPPHHRGRTQGRCGRLGHRAPGQPDQDRDLLDTRGRLDPIEYTDAVYDEQSSRWLSRAEVAEIPFTAFVAQKKTNHVPGRLIVRRIPDLNSTKTAGQETLFDT
jgi:hypothetical protein